MNSRSWPVTVGADGFDLMERIFALGSPPWLREVPSVEVLREVWQRRYYRVATDDGPEVESAENSIRAGHRLATEAIEHRHMRQRLPAGEQQGEAAFPLESQSAQEHVVGPDVTGQFGAVFRLLDRDVYSLMR